MRGKKYNNFTLFPRVFLSDVLNGHGSGFINAYCARGMLALRGSFQINKNGGSRKSTIEVVVWTRGWGMGVGVG
jgi:hypothetical protein